MNERRLRADPPVLRHTTSAHATSAALIVRRWKEHRSYYPRAELTGAVWWWRTRERAPEVAGIADAVRVPGRVAVDSTPPQVAQ